MLSFFIIIFLVMLAELGDKSQILVMLLSYHFKKPLTILAGLTFACCLNFLIAGLIGIGLKKILHPQVIHWLTIVVLIICAILILFVKHGKTIEKLSKNKKHVFIITTVSIFLLELGDKSQFLIVALSASYGNLFLVVFAGVIGMLIANVPAIFLGNYLKKIITFKYLKYVSSLVFLAAAVGEMLKG